MCLAIYAPVGVTIARDRLSHGWDNNPDGGGYAFIDEFGAIQVRKYQRWMDFADGYQRDHAANTKSPFILHERFATHGVTDDFNIHPFQMDEHTVVMHNGVINCWLTDKKRSDTRTFVEDYLTKLPDTWMDDPAMVDMVEDYIRGSKLIILTTNPAAKKDVYVLNEKAGHWDRGAWWSNHGYRPSLKLHGYGMGYTVKAGATTRSSKDAKVPAPSSNSHKWWENYDEDGWDDLTSGYTDWPEDDRQGTTNCWLCGDKTHAGPVCFTCEWCEQCSQEFWTCDHINDQSIVNEYVDWWNSRPEEARDFDDEYLDAGLELVTDPEVVESINAKIRKP